MNKIAIIGAGLSSTTLISYLIKQAEIYNWEIIVADYNKELAERKVNGSKHAVAIAFDIHDANACSELISKVDVIISMLPARYHPLVANECVIQKKHMITASYVSDEIKSLEQKAKENNIVILNELGVDPGIDHMSAMKIIDNIQAQKGKLISFTSNTGGLVAPEFDNNPWHYKFTWNPRNVVLAGQGVSQNVENGHIKYVPYNQLFKRLETTRILEYGDFEIYPNRDSLKYRSIYGIDDIPTLKRGTMRRIGYCKAWNVFVQLGMTDDSYIYKYKNGDTYRDFINSFLPYNQDNSVEEKLVNYLKADINDEIMQKLSWLGIFSNKPITSKPSSPAQILQLLLEEKWALGVDDKDMIAMQHKFVYELNGKKKQIISSMVVFGEDTSNTAMAITVGMPVAIATKLLMLGKIKLTGVHVPTDKKLYEPILKELESYNIKFIEEEFDI